MKLKRSILIIAALLLAVGCSDDASDDASNNNGTDVDVRGDDAADAREDAVEDDVEDIVELEGTKLRFEPESADFFSVPMPSDTRLLEDGSAALHQWEGAYDNQLVKLWFDAADDLMDGWGLVSGVFMNFSAPIDAQTLPHSAAETTREIGSEDGPASVFLMDVDPGSAQKGKLLPIECKFTEPAGKYHDANLLSCVSPFGVVRQPDTRYALVVTTALKDEQGDALVPGLAMQKLLKGARCAGPARDDRRRAVCADPPDAG